MQIDKLAVLGVGLIGGSVAAALRAGGSVGEIAGYAPGDDAQVARALGFIDTAHDSPEAAVEGATLVVVAAPVPEIPALFERIRNSLGPQTLITDCGSTKRSVIDAARATLGETFLRFVPGHPIAGAELSGPQAARAGLFRDRRWLLCPVDATPAQHCESVREMLAPTGAHFDTMDAALHDRVFAEISHWPHAVAFALSAAIASGELAEQAIEYSGAGLRDTTRVGASSPTLWAGILLDNREACLASAARFRGQLDALLEALEAGDRDRLADIFATASRWRSRLG